MINDQVQLGLGTYRIVLLAPRREHLFGYIDVALAQAFCAKLDLQLHDAPLD